MSRKPPLSDEVEAMIPWLPLSARDMAPAVLAAVQPVAQRCLRSAKPRNRDQAQELLRAMYLYLEWALRKRETLNTATVWHPNTVENYLDDVKDERSLPWRQNHRIFLARVGRAANPTGWPRRPAPLNRSPFAQAYSAAREAALCLAAELRCLQQGGAAELFTVVGSMGAGMSGTEIADAEPCHIINLTDDRLGINVVRRTRAGGADPRALHAPGRARGPVRQRAAVHRQDQRQRQRGVSRRGTCRRRKRGPSELPARPQHLAERAPSRRNRSGGPGAIFPSGQG